MKKIFLFLFVLIIKQSVSQEIIVSKVNINELLKQFEISDSKNNQDSYLEMAEIASFVSKNSQAINEIVLSSNKVITLNNDEKVAFLNNNNLVTTIINKTKLERTLIKYDIVNNKNELKRINLPLEGELKFINKNGSFVFITYGDGEAFIYDFYNNNFELINSYKPYDHGFMFTKFDCLLDRTIIVSQKAHSSNVFKITTLKNFQIDTEKEIDINGYIISNIKIINDNIIILINSKENPTAKILCLDNSLLLNWYNIIDGRIYGNELITNSYLENFFYINKHELICVDVNKGTLKWKNNININNAQNYLLTEKIIANRYLILNKADYSEQNNNYPSNFLNIIDINNGKIFYNEDIGSSLKEIKIFNEDSSFFIFKDDQGNKYKIQIIE